MERDTEKKTVKLFARSADIIVPTEELTIPGFYNEVAAATKRLKLPATFIAQTRDYADKYDLDEREYKLLAIELGFFREGRCPKDDSAQYSLDYLDLANRIINGNTGKVYELGWRLRWGATTESVNTAVRSQLAKPSIDEATQDVADELPYVIFNTAHEDTLNEYGLCIRGLAKRRTKSANNPDRITIIGK